MLWGHPQRVAVLGAGESGCKVSDGGTGVNGPAAPFWPSALRKGAGPRIPGLRPRDARLSKRCSASLLKEEEEQVHPVTLADTDAEVLLAFQHFTAEAEALAQRAGVDLDHGQFIKQGGLG